jgi:hypothetical protein
VLEVGVEEAQTVSTLEMEGHPEGVNGAAPWRRPKISDNLIIR